MTTVTLFWGWWGLISLIVTPFFLLNNIIRYIGCISMPPVPPGATVIEQTYEASVQLMPRQLAARKRPRNDAY